MRGVIIVGGGPTGSMLAAELRLHGVDVLVLERDAQPSPLVRSLGLHPRTVEIMDQRGLLDRFLAEGTVYPGGARTFAGIPVPDEVTLDSAHAYILGIPQPVTDRILAERAEGLGAEVRRGVEVTGAEQDDSGAVVVLADGSRIRADWVVGADGGRSTVRRAAGIGFPGEPARTEWLLAELELTASPEEVAAVSDAVRRTHRGFGFGPTPGGWFRGVVPAAAVTEDRTTAPTLDEFRERLREYAGTDLGAHGPRALSRFTDATRLADRYRASRLLLAGDAAHVHPPLGGQGLNLGVQDAVNLGWKLAATIAGWAPTGLLDTYEAERQPVAAEVLSTSRAQSELIEPSAGAQAVRRLVTTLAAMPDAGRYLVEHVSGLGIRYDVGQGPDEPLVGRRLRDLPIGDGHLYGRMHHARGLLLDPTGALSADGWADRVDHVVESIADPALDAPAVLLRPDGYVVWAGDDQRELTVRLTQWFGAPTEDATRTH